MLFLLIFSLIDGVNVALNLDNLIRVFRLWFDSNDIGDGYSCTAEISLKRIFGLVLGFDSFS